jgi:hypothetical protein
VLPSRQRCESRNVDPSVGGPPSPRRLAADENLNRRAGARCAVDRRLLAGCLGRAGSAVARAGLGATTARDAGLARGTGDAVVAGDATVCVAVPATGPPVPGLVLAAMVIRAKRRRNSFGDPR